MDDDELRSATLRHDVYVDVEHLSPEDRADVEYLVNRLDATEG